MNYELPPLPVSDLGTVQLASGMHQQLGHSDEAVRAYGAACAEAAREAIAAMTEGKPETRDGRPARRGPGDAGTWYESSATGFLVRSLVRSIRARGQA